MIGSRHGRREANRTPTGQFYELTEDTDVSEEIREVM